MARNKEIILETGQRFSQSMLWSAQREYYHQQGVTAWVDEVPFYITSNPFIGDNYARLIVRFMQDWVRLHPDTAKAPFYIMELGAGSGQFSFYVLKRLKHYLEKLHLDDLQIRYVMTDFTENNVKFWTEHPALKLFLEKNMLDFAVCDIENVETIKLIKSGEVLNQETLKNPLIVIANYLFDSVVTDIFSVKDKKLSEDLVSIATTEDNLVNDKPKNWKQVKFSYEEQAAKENYYDNVAIDQVLNSYKEDLKDTHFLFPIGSLRGLERLKKLSNNRMLLISSDKGYHSADDLDNCEYPELDFHGSFSVMVNFDAIRRFFEMQDGDCFTQTARDGLLTAVFSSGFKLNDLIETQYVLAQTVEGFSPTDYFNFYDHLTDTYEDAKLDFLASFLNVSLWDPFIFEEISDRIEELLPDASEELVDYLTQHMPCVADNFYYIPEAHDTYFDVAYFLQEAEEYQKAIEYYQLSEEYFEANNPLYFNIGICHYYLENYKDALDYLERALELDPKSRDTKVWINKAEKKIQ